MATEAAGRVLAGVVASLDPLRVNVLGPHIEAFWPAGYIPRKGDAVRVRLQDGVADVLGPVITTRRPVVGTVTGAPSGGRVPVDALGKSYECRYTGADPSIGDQVRFVWDTTEAWIMPSTVSPEPPPPEPEPDPDDDDDPAPPPPPPETGRSTFSAVSAGRYRTSYGRWDLDDVVQGYYSSSSNNSNGAWFFGSAPTRLKGRTITKFEIYVPRRLRIGSYNSTLTAHFYRHTSKHRPSGDVNRVGSSTDRSIRSGWSGGWIQLPAPWGQEIADHGGGIAIAGQPYLGFAITGGARIRLAWRR